MIIKKKLIPSDIDFLNRDNCLYVNDFRALSENMEYKIPAMWKYENIFPWILSGKSVTTNEDAEPHTYGTDNKIIKVPKLLDPRVSICKRLESCDLGKDITDVWVSVPHPDADIFCREHNLVLNYSFDEYVRLNDKIAQKRLWKELTPEWNTISSYEQVNQIKTKPNCYVKRACGSGGFTVFKSQNLDENFETLFRDFPEGWYVENEIFGKSCSIQCVALATGDIVIFGYSEQIIDDGRFYTGSKIHDLDMMDDGIFRQLVQALEKLAPFLSAYSGFFGIDFIIEESRKVNILEANIRLTAASIPTLLVNAQGASSATYREEVPLDAVQKGDIMLTQGQGFADVLTIR